MSDGKVLEIAQYFIRSVWDSKEMSSN